MIKYAIRTILLFLLFFVTSCTKKEPQLTLAQIQQNTIIEIRKIVGNNGTISVNNNDRNNKLSTYSALSILDTNRLISLTLEQFKDIYNALKTDTFWTNVNDKLSTSDSTKNIKSLSDFYDDEDPLYPKGPKQEPGYHMIQFARSVPFLPYQYNSSYFSNLNLQYYSDQNGYVIGSPSISFSGINIFKWNQNFLSSIENQSDGLYQIGNSSFTIGGGAEYSILFGTFTWTSPLSYKITIDIYGNISIRSGLLQQ